MRDRNGVQERSKNKLADEKLKIAVFIDFDNIEIGVKSTLGRHFDVGVVLEAIKERGEVVTKIAYGDWKRAGDYSRHMSQYAIHMVQRNLTPGGDKNGADINLALDALEMAFTKNHINAFVIVGGDSDFMALVEKLKQYDKKVFIVGGRSFTSVILQKNCHEFITYENLVMPQRKAAEKGGRPVVDVAKVLPLLRRALKVLAEREVSPQLGLLKSTLLQLDSTFTERDYGASTFRDFIQKMADAGFVLLKQVDRSLLVEMRDVDGSAEEPGEPAPVAAPSPAPAAPAEPVDGVREVATPIGPPQAEDAVRAIQDIFAASKSGPKWPMYLRNVKNFFRSVNPEFDERKYGFSQLLDLLRQAQRVGVIKLERNRQGILRVFPGVNLRGPGMPAHVPVEEAMTEMVTDAAGESTPDEVSVSVESQPEPVDTVVEPQVEMEEYTGPEPGNEALPASGEDKSRKRKRAPAAATRRKPAASRAPRRKKPDTEA